MGSEVSIGGRESDCFLFGLRQGVLQEGLQCSALSRIFKVLNTWRVPLSANSFIQDRVGAGEEELSKVRAEYVLQYCTMDGRRTGVARNQTRSGDDNSGSSVGEFHGTEQPKEGNKPFEALTRETCSLIHNRVPAGCHW